MKFKIKFANGRTTTLFCDSEEKLKNELISTTKQFNSQITEINEQPVKKLSLGGFLVGTLLGGILGNSVAKSGVKKTAKSISKTTKKTISKTRKGVSEFRSASSKSKKFSGGGSIKTKNDVNLSNFDSEKWGKGKNSINVFFDKKGTIRYVFDLKDNFLKKFSLDGGKTNYSYDGKGYNPEYSGGGGIPSDFIYKEVFDYAIGGKRPKSIITLKKQVDALAKRENLTVGELYNAVKDAEYSSEDYRYGYGNGGGVGSMNKWFVMINYYEPNVKEDKSGNKLSFWRKQYKVEAISKEDAIKKATALYNSAKANKNRQIESISASKLTSFADGGMSSMGLAAASPQLAIGNEISKRLPATTAAIDKKFAERVNPTRPSIWEDRGLQKMATGGTIGQEITFKHWTGDIKTGTITEDLGNGNFEVASGYGKVLVNKSDFISLAQKMAKGAKVESKIFKHSKYNITYKVQPSVQKKGRWEVVESSPQWKENQVYYFVSEQDAINNAKMSAGIKKEADLESRFMRNKYSGGGSTGSKVFNEMNGNYFGGTKYLVNFHDGKKIHSDNSPFYDMRLFRSKEMKDKFIEQLKSEGYKQTYSGGGSTDEQNTYVVDVHTEIGEDSYTIDATSGQNAFEEAKRLFKQENPQFKGEILCSMRDKYAEGGGVRMHNGREYSYGRNWTNDHRHHNKSEDYEVPMADRKNKLSKGTTIKPASTKKNTYLVKGFANNYNNSVVEKSFDNLKSAMRFANTIEFDWTDDGTYYLITVYDSKGKKVKTFDEDKNLDKLSDYSLFKDLQIFDASKKEKEFANKKLNGYKFKLEVLIADVKGTVILKETYDTIYELIKMIGNFDEESYYALINKKDLEYWEDKLAINKFALGGGIDLFEDYEQQPPAVAKLMKKYEETFEDGDYEKLAEAEAAFEKIGYTFDYYLDGVAYDLRPIGTKGKVEE